MQEILTYTFIQNAILAAVLSGVCCGIVGTYMVTRRLLFMGGGITHSSLGGIGLAYYLGFSTTLGALLFAICSALGIDLLSRKARSGHLSISEDSAVSVVWSAGMALGIIFIFLSPGYAPNLMSYLFGNILFTSTSQLWWLLVFDLVLLGVFAVFGRVILYSALDEEYSRAQGLPVRTINLLMLVVLSVAIVLNIRILGIMLMLSMLTIPTLVAQTLSSKYYKITAISALIAIVSVIVGLVVSYLYDLPTSAISIAILVVLLIAGTIKKRLVK